MNSNNLQAERPARDWFLIAIVAGIGLLVIIALIFGLRSPAEAEYREGGQPEDAAYNYLLAIQREEYGRAYGYVYSDLEGYPADLNRFSTDVISFREWNCAMSGDSRSISYSVDDANPVSIIGDQAIVTVSEETYYRNRSIFSPSSTYSRDFRMELVNTDAGWKVVESDRCWRREWTTPETDSQSQQKGDKEV